MTHQAVRPSQALEIKNFGRRQCRDNRFTNPLANLKPGSSETCLVTHPKGETA